MQPLVISFYTLGTPYEKEVKKLIDSCVQFDIESDIVGLTSQGSWEKNCAMKPLFMLQKMKEWDRPVLWVDADAAFLRAPNLQEFAEYDFSARVNEFLPKHHESRILSGTIYASNTPSAINVLEKWGELSKKVLHDTERKMEFWDQTALRDAIALNENLRFFPMPLKFVKIFDFDDLFISEQEVVIEHYQASRRYKHSETMTIKHDFPSHHCCH
jgi:hypothetical protein